MNNCKLILSTGWFPYFTYSATWAGEIYMKYDAEVELKTSEDVLSQVGRIGSLILVIFSTVTLIASVILPWVVESPEIFGAENASRASLETSTTFIRFKKYKPSLLTTWKYSHLMFMCAMLYAPWIRSLHSVKILVIACGM